MATLTRSKDHSIWFGHIDDPDNVIQPQLRELQPGQAVVLQIGDQQGMWRRYARTIQGESPEALKTADDRAKTIWDSLAVGDASDISVVRIIEMDDEARLHGEPKKKSSGKRAARKKAVPKGLPQFVRACEKVQGRVLCLGVDVAWWGGQTGTSHRSTRSECIAYALRSNERWGELLIDRVDLNESYNPDADEFTPNADPEAALLLERLGVVLDTHQDVDKVVLAFDVPLMARHRPDLTKPPKTRDAGSKGGVNRQCDSAWQKEKKKSPEGWKDIKILAGAPLVPRLEKLVEGLMELNVTIYKHPFEGKSKRFAIECFPNEVIWSSGILGNAANFSSASLLAYKRLGQKNIRLPSDIFDAIWQHTLKPALKTALLDDQTQTRWLETIAEFLRKDGVITEKPPEGKSGKKFDDAIDSVLSLTAAIALANGAAHVHQGDEAEDGHIVGPGLPDSDSLQADDAEEAR